MCQNAVLVTASAVILKSYNMINNLIVQVSSRQNQLKASAMEAIVGMTVVYFTARRTSQHKSDDNDNKS